jgi:2-polyprenyl-3-methyl-5-hydroxy-6-metoxy-1,4-benzoquinol methylase
MSMHRTFPPGDDALDPLSDRKIVDSWHKNAASWTAAVRDNRIESRVLVTNQAIVDAVVDHAPASVLDVGCGEGWLVRALSALGMRATGIDIIPELIDQAKRAGGGEFHVASYEDLIARTFEATADVVVANFSLIGKESVDGLVRHATALLSPGGALVVQTLHPMMARGDLPYVDGWRSGSWTGFGDDFTDPAPWYFRTIETWVALIADSNLRLVEMREPLYSATQVPASIIFIAEVSS